MARDQRKPGFLQAAGAVFWAFFGVRKRRQGEADAVGLSPVQVIVAGLVGAALFVLALLLVVRLLVNS